MNLWVARSPSQPFISPKGGREGGRVGTGWGAGGGTSHLEQHPQKNSQPTCSLCRERDAMHILNASLLFFIADVSCMTLTLFEVVVKTQSKKKKKENWPSRDRHNHKHKQYKGMLLLWKVRKANVICRWFTINCACVFFCLAFFCAFFFLLFFPQLYLCAKGLSQVSLSCRSV